MQVIVAHDAYLSLYGPRGDGRPRPSGEAKLRGTFVTINMMPAPRTQPIQARWYLIPVRVLLVTFLLTLLAFALSLLLGIISLVVAGRLRGIHPNLTLAYRHIALPAAVAVAGITLISSTIAEIRNYRQTKALLQIERASR